MNIVEYRQLKQSKKLKSSKRSKFNTEEIIFEGIKFRSQLEVRCYKELKKTGIKFKYEERTYVIFNKFELDPLVSFYGPLHKKVKVEKSTSKKTTRTVTYFVKDTRFINQVCYTPDFVIELEDKKILIIIETKGKENDVYPYKRKLFLKFLSRLARLKNMRILFMEPHNYTQITECINIITTL